VPVLPYCIILAEGEVTVPASGVGGSQIEALLECGLRCFYSVLSDLPLASAAALKNGALRFDGVVRGVLQQTAVIPFRFPTLLVNGDELRKFMADKAAEYIPALNRLAGVVQLELRIERASLAPTAMNSGKVYLESRAAEIRTVSEQAGQARAAAGDLVREWRTRDIPRGLRCYALVARDRASEFLERMRSLSTPEDVTIAVSGPWPATEFFDGTAQS
jgi:hypothetical protein